jgi:hypothetical protein
MLTMRDVAKTWLAKHLGRVAAESMGSREHATQFNALGKLRTTKRPEISTGHPTSNRVISIECQRDVVWHGCT